MALLVPSRFRHIAMASTADAVPCTNPRHLWQPGIVPRSGYGSPGPVFRAEDMLKVFVSRLILSEVGPGRYLVPCVLGVSNIYPTQMSEGNVRSSFILHFSKKSPMCGLYCCTTSSLMSDAGWKLLTEGGEVAQVARNSITFEMPLGFPGQLTFRDPLSSS